MKTRDAGALMLALLFCSCAKGGEATSTTAEGSAAATQVAAPAPLAAPPAAAAASAGSGAVAVPAPAAEPGGSGATAEPARSGLGFGATPPDQAAGTTAHYGWAFASTATPIPIEQAVGTCSDTGATCRITARVSAVCQNKGCWFTLVSPSLDREVRVKMKDYAFFLPRNAAGGEVVIEGVLSAKVIPQAEAQHYADDEAKAGKPARRIEGDVKAYQLMASGVDLTIPVAAPSR